MWRSEVWIEFLHSYADAVNQIQRDTQIFSQGTNDNKLHFYAIFMCCNGCEEVFKPIKWQKLSNKNIWMAVQTWHVFFEGDKSRFGTKDPAKFAWNSALSSFYTKSVMHALLSLRLSIQHGDRCALNFYWKCTKLLNDWYFLKCQNITKFCREISHLERDLVFTNKLARNFLEQRTQTHFTFGQLRRLRN